MDQQAKNNLTRANLQLPAIGSKRSDSKKLKVKEPF